jgi:uncharacterized protein (TIGR02271 family)
MNETAAAEQQPESDKPVNTTPINDELITIPVIEEQLRVDKQVVETGRVQVIKTVTEEEVTVDLPVMHEETEVKRIEVNQYVEQAPPSVRYEGDTMIIPVLREVVVVEKRLMLVEEVHITKRKVEAHVPQKITLRKEAIQVNRLDPTSGEAASDLDIDINLK